MTYAVELESRARRELMDLPKDAVRLLVPAIEDLMANPRPPASRKLSGVDGYRIRKGPYRILYTINDSSRLIRIYRIGHRRDIYRRLSP